MTTAQNNLVKNWGPELPYAVKTDGTADFNQGDLVYFDTSAKVVKAAATDANCQYLAGVAGESSNLTLYGTKVYPDSGSVSVKTKGTFSFGTTTGDTYSDGDAVYIGADAQTVTNQAATYAVGYVKLRPGVTSLAGGTGTVKVDVVLYTRFPVANGL